MRLIDEIVNDGIWFAQQNGALRIVIIFYFDAGNLRRVTRCPAHARIKIGGHGNDGIINLGAENFFGVPQHMLKNPRGNLSGSNIGHFGRKPRCKFIPHLTFDRFCHQMRTHRITFLGKIADHRLIMVFVIVIHTRRQRWFPLSIELRALDNGISIDRARYLNDFAYDIAVEFDIYDRQH